LSKSVLTREMQHLLHKTTLPDLK